MSSNSWRKYGGISNSNDFNTLNAGTIVADKFISRSVRPTYQYYNGTYEVSQDLSAGVNILAGNSTYTQVDAYVNRNIYANQKIYFGGGEFEITGNVFPELPPETTHAYFYGDVSNIGVNTLTPKTIFNITGKIEEDTDILTVESGNIYIRNILGQNKNAQGVVLDANETQSNIHFYTDVSTNAANKPDATIKYTSGHVLSTTTQQGITSRSRYTRTDTSGGVVYFDEEVYRVDASVNMYFDSSSNIYVHAYNDIAVTADNEYRLDASNGLLRIDDMGLLLSTDGTMVLNSSGGLVQVFSEVAQFNTLLDFAPPARGISLESLHNETLAVYDNSNSVYLKNVYNDDNIQTGNAITAVAKDASANTFIRMIAPVNNRGSAIGGGVYPKDTDRSMAMFGLSDSSGSYIPSQMIVSSNRREKYVSTLGINTFSPTTEQYVLDINGPMHVGNGEINTVADANFEIKQMSFSQVSQNHGIAVGTPSTTTPENYQQYLLYTTDGGKTWTPSDIYARTTTVDEQQFEVLFNVVDVYDSSYAFVGGNLTNFAYITNDGGKTWVRIQGLYPIVAAKLTVSNGTIRVYASELMNDLSHNIFYIEITAADLNTNNTINPSKINEQIITDITPKKSILTQNYIYLAGTNGIMRYNRSGLTNKVHVVSNANVYYNDIYAYDEQNIIAVGENVISYYANNSWTTHTNISYGNLQSVFMYDTDNIVAVGASGKFLYTKTGPAAGNWKDVPEYILNTSGMKDRLVGAENDLRGIAMPDKNTFIIADVISTYVSNENTGQSKIQYSFLPNLLNREENVVIDVCGNMVISGDVYIKDDGKLYVDATTVLNGDVSMNSRLFVQEDVSLNSKLFVKSDVSLNSNFYVKEKTIHNGDVSMNSKLFVQDDVSLNSRLFVQDQIRMPSLSNVLVNIIDGHNDGLFYEPNTNETNTNETNTNHSRNIHIGGNTRITNIGPVDLQRKKNIGDVLADDNRNYINIGATESDNKPVIIWMGDYARNTLKQPNRIYIGGGNDEVEIAGRVQFTTQDQMRVNNKLIELNANENGDDTSAESGIIIRDNSNSHAGYLLVSKNRQAYNLQAPYLGSHPVAIETHQMNLSDFITPNSDIGIKDQIDNGIVVLTKGLNSDASYSLVVRQLDISNILVRDAATSNDDYQNILTNLIVKKDISLNGRLFVKADASFNANVYIKKDLTVDGNLMVRHNAINQYIINTTTMDYTLIVAEDLSLNGRMYVEDDVSLNANLYVRQKTVNQGDVSMNSKLYVQDDVSLNANFYVDSTTTLNGAVAMKNQLVVDLTTVNKGDVSMNSRLYVGQDASFNSNMYINNRTTNNGDVSMNSRLYVGQDASFNSNVYINNQTTNNGDVLMNSRLYVGQDASFNQNVYITGDLSLNGDMYASANIEVDGSMNIAGNVSIGKPTSAAKLEVYRDAAPINNIGSTGTVFKASYIRTTGARIDETGIRVGEYNLGEATNRTDIPLSVYGHGNELLRITTTTLDPSNNRVYIQPWVGIGTANPTTSVDISYTDAIRIPRGSTAQRPVSQDVEGTDKASYIGSIRYNTETSQFEGFGPGDAWGSLGGVINVAQNTRIKASHPNADSTNNELMFFTNDVERMRIYASGDVSMNERLFVHKDVSLNGNVYIKEKTTLNSDVSMNSRLTVGNDASFNRNVYITGTTTNNGDVSMNSGLIVGNDASFNKNVYINGKTTLNSDVSMNSRLYVGQSVQASEYTATSDYRIKENTTPLRNENYKVDELNPVSYFNKSVNRKDIGLIAHELQEHFPFLVNGEKDGQSHQTVNYIGLIGLLIHEVQQLKLRVSELEAQQR